MFVVAYGTSPRGCGGQLLISADKGLRGDVRGITYCIPTLCTDVFSI